MKKLIAIAVIATATLSSFAGTPVYADTEKPLEQRIEDALNRMTLQEKINIIHAQSKFSSPGVPHLGIPELWTSDGPHGIRAEVSWDNWKNAGWTNDSVVAFPSLTCLAATWNPEMSALYGQVIGEEALYRGKNVLLGPGVNIYRTPLNGRNFEYMGEDPYLTSRMAVPYIKNVQKQGVATCVKHYALNNNEINRHTTNVTLDDRALYEIYLPAFKAAVTEGGSWSIMGAYNLYNGVHACHNNRLLNEILKGEWAYDGAVISDWGGAHDTREAITNGLDLEYGTHTDGLSEGLKNSFDAYYLAKPYFDLIAAGEVDTIALNDKVRRVLRLICRTAMNGNTNLGKLCSEDHYEAARRIADEGIVLLKNEKNILPLKPGKHILVVGENATKMMTVGGGSSSLKAQHEVLPLDGLRAALPDAIIDYAKGYFSDPKENTGSAEDLFNEAVDMAGQADYIIFVGGLNKRKGQDCENADRADYNLPYGQDKLIEALADRNPNIIFVNISGNAVAMPWIKKIPGIIQAWYGGSEAGNAIADVLTGKVNPSGRLPFSFPVRLEDNAAHACGAYPGTKRPDENIVDLNYDEGILVGYRWHDTKKKRPLFAFGHGLSYTTFSYGKLKYLGRDSNSDEMKFSIDISNTGDRFGAETVQLYISDPECSVLRPTKELKRFQKVYLEPGETKTVEFSINPEDLAFFDADAHEWKVEDGNFIAHAAAAADNIKSSVTFKYVK